MRRWGDVVTAEQHCPKAAALDFKMQRLHSPDVLYVSSFAKSVYYSFIHSLHAFQSEDQMRCNTS